MYRSSRRGMTLIETLVVLLMMGFIGTGIFQLIRAGYDSQYTILGQNASASNARAAVDQIVDEMRGATAVTSAAASDITFTHANGTIRYWRNSADNTIRRTVGGAPAGGNIVMLGASGLTFLYWSYTTSWASSSTPSDVTKVGAVDITITGTSNGVSRQVSGSVQIRQKRLAP
jgi:type II secretory pathway pseudopilin PulG